MRMGLIIIIFLSVAGCAQPGATDVSRAAEPNPEPDTAPAGAGELGPRAPFTERIPGTVVEFEMVPVGDIYVAKTETTWDMYDVYVYGLDVQGEAPGEGGRTADGAPTPDAVTRPSKPYVPPDRGYGHAGYPALSMTFDGARRYCEWLSAKTGRKYRLPTETEWKQAAGNWPADEAAVRLCAWESSNASYATHAVGSRQANAHGLYDMLGNVAEWVVGDDGKPVALGGSFRQSSGEILAGGRLRQDSTWNMSDPQIPKSKWWLADADFIGFRVVCETDNLDTRREAQPGVMIVDH